jgi:membrane peptidoglycan carboxypeptidase
MYQQAIANMSLPDKVEQIRSSENYIKIENMPQDYKNAVISIEDHRFESHGGIDYIATFRAVIKDISEGQLSEGGSTITQQLAKNMYFTKEKKFERKVAELLVAFKLEKEYSKDDILEMYINIMYFGSGYYGIGDACEGYLYKEPIEMTLYESTLLAGLPNAPSVYALNENPQLAKERQKQVLNSMVKYNYLSQSEAEAVINQSE